MVELVAKTPAEGLTFVKGKRLSLSEIALGRVTSVAPFKGRSADVERVLGSGLPEVGQSKTSGSGELVWFSQGQFLAIEMDVDAAASKSAALTDQTDAWCALMLLGRDAEAVLARLVPLDLRIQSFAIGQALRSQLGHLPLHITRMENDGFRLMSFRSMAATMVHEITRANELFSGRG